MKRLVLIFLILFGFCNLSHAAITTTAYNTPDDVTIDALESNRVTFTDAINSADGGLLQDESVTAAKLDDNANPEVRWDEGFNDFVFTGLTIPTSADLTTTTTSGIAYILGTRVVKAATGKTYTGSRYTYVDLSNNGTYTYQEITFGATVPSVTTNSIRLARVSTDATTVLQVDDERVTQITIAAGSAGSIADTDADTGIKTEQADDEDILRFSIGAATLTTAREVLTIQAIDADDVKIEPTTDSDVDIGSTSKRFKDLYVDTITSADIAQYYVGGTTYDLTTATGTQAITGVGFVPKAVFLFAAVNGEIAASWGYADATAERSIRSNYGATSGDFGQTTRVITIEPESTGSQDGAIASFDADGFTISWAKAGAAAGTLQLIYFCIR